MNEKKVRDLSHKPTDLTGKTIVLQVRDCCDTLSVRSPTIKVTTQQVHLVAGKEKKSFGGGTQIVSII